MLKVMVFIDYENFEIARKRLYEGGQLPRVDWAELPRKMTAITIGEDARMMKAFLFAPEPDDTLSQQEWRVKHYEFLKGLENVDYFSFVPGKHCARSTTGNSKDINLDDKATYYVVEKGTDVNITTQLLVKAFHNSYDIAVVLSGDTDYIPVYDQLDAMGKQVVVVGVEGQKLGAFKTHTDRQVHLSKEFLDSCLTTYCKNNGK